MRDILEDTRALTPKEQETEPQTDPEPESVPGSVSESESESGPIPFRQRPIALVGLMGVGKTTVGRRLARKLDRAFFDSDEEIEKASGRTVAGYFRDHGEAAFRNGERRVIERLLEQPDLVLATGGGAFIHPTTHEVLRARALVVWLQGDFETIMERVSRKNTRPLLHVPDPRAKMRELMAEREPIYARAHVTVSVGKGAHARTVGRVERAIAKYLSQRK